MENEIIIFKTSDEKISVDVFYENETVWLTQNQMAELFQKNKSTISRHIKNIFEEGELSEISVVAKNATTAADGKTYQQDYYNLDVIISVGYRVKSMRGTQFRQWATEKIHEYIIKGFTMDDDRLKENGGGNYFKELLDRIRDIRSSEKVLYRQVLDLYATAIDYEPNKEENNHFFATVQNKLHFAISGHTAAEIIYNRANAEKEFMGLTSFKGLQPIKKEVTIAKNYLAENELKNLNNLVSAFFDLAENRARNNQKTTIKDYVTLLDSVITINGSDILKDNGKVSQTQATSKALGEYKKYQQKTLSQVEKDYLDTLEKLKKIK
jgi:hypothetical protein